MGAAARRTSISSSTDVAQSRRSVRGQAVDRAAIREAFRVAGPAWPNGPVGEAVAGARVGSGRVRLAAVVDGGEASSGECDASVGRFAARLATEARRLRSSLCVGVGLVLAGPEELEAAALPRLSVRHAVVFSRRSPLGEMAVEHPDRVEMSILGDGLAPSVGEVVGVGRMDAVERAISRLQESATDALVGNFDLDVTLRPRLGALGMPRHGALVEALGGASPRADVRRATERESALLGIFAGGGVVFGCRGADPREVAQIVRSVADSLAGDR